MRIPGGDLAPARRRRYGGAYGRRRRRQQRVLALVLVVGIGATGAWLLRRDDTRARDRVTAGPSPTPCATPSAAPAPVALPQPRQVRLALLNGTSRNGLAKAIGDQLAARGFVVTAQANAPAALAGASQVAYGAGAAASAELVTHWVLGSVAASDPACPAEPSR